MLGLTLALRLSAVNVKVTLLEASPFAGGLTSSWQVGDVTWDRYYHVTMLSDQYLRELLTELDLQEDIDWQVTRTNFYSTRGMYPLNNALDYMKLPVIGLIDKVRLGLNIVLGSKIEDGQQFESITAKEWLSKWSGKNTYEQIWRPLLRAKLGSNYQKASAAFIWSVIRRFYAARRGGMKTEMFGYVSGGYERIVGRLIQQLQDRNVTILTNAKVQLISKNIQNFSVQTTAGPYEFDSVINTCASNIIADVCNDLPQMETQQHRGITYQGIVCPSVVLSRPLGGAYLTYITDESIPFTAVIEMSSIVNSKDLKGNHLVYLPKYVPSDDAIFELSDEQIEQQFVAALLRMFPDLKSEEILAFKVSRTRQVVAVSTLNYSQNLPPMNSGISGLYAINSAQIINASLSVNDTVALANRGASMVIEKENLV